MSKTLIIEAVEAAGRIKAIELVSTLFLDERGNVQPSIALLDSPTDLIDECVKEGSIQEIEYISPQIPYRIKSLLLAKNADRKEAENWLVSQGFKLKDAA